MIKFTADIEIPAHPRRVWDALMDFPSYLEWNPYVAVRGRAALGSEIEWSYPTPLIGRVWTAGIINEFDELNAIAWSFGIGWLFSLEERFYLHQTQSGTLLTHSAKCGGMIALLAGRRLKKTFAAVVCGANQGLYHYINAPRRVSPCTFAKPPTQGKSARKKRLRARSRRR